MRFNAINGKRVNATGLPAVVFLTADWSHRPHRPRSGWRNPDTSRT